MRRPLVTAGVLSALAAVPLVVALLIRPGDRARAVDVYVLFLGAVLLLVLARMTAPSHRTKEPLPPRAEQASIPRLPELARIEREVVLATGSGFDQQMRISPLLRDIAQHRLWTQRGIDLEESPDRARALLGSDVWELVKPGPPDPSSRWVQALDLAGLRRAVQTIEEI